MRHTSRDSSAIAVTHGANNFSPSRVRLRLLRGTVAALQLLMFGEVANVVAGEAPKLKEQGAIDQTISAVIGGETLVFPVEWIRTRNLYLNLPDKRQIGPNNVDEFLHRQVIEVYSADILTAGLDRPNPLPAFSASLPELIGIRGYSLENLEGNITEIRRQSKVTLKAGAGRALDQYGYWILEREKWVLSNPRVPRPFHEPLVVWCAKINLGELCRGHFSWSSSVGVSYAFSGREFPRSEWERLDSQVLSLLTFLHRDGRRAQPSK